MDDPNITMEEYIRLEEEQGVVAVTVSKQDLRSVETEFPAIFYDDALTSEVALLCEPTVSPLNDNKIDFRISFDESDDEDYTDNDEDKIDIKHSSGDNVINTDDGTYAQSFQAASDAANVSDTVADMQVSRIEHRNSIQNSKSVLGNDPTINKNKIFNFDSKINAAVPNSFMAKHFPEKSLHFVTRM
ncbi:hypothetical protein Tco_0450234 [Tanacetum coccineum]